VKTGAGKLILATCLRIFSHRSLSRYPVRISASLAALSFLLIPPAFSQFTAPPKREVRAVWIATAAGLDWPRTTDRIVQQNDLRAILSDLHRAHFNTLFFQVRARGDAYYHSAYEPWAENLTGTLGKDPGWDPLAFLTTEAHTLGMEVHAWFNLYKIRGPNPVPASAPPHISRTRPKWTVSDEGELWLDPGIPGVTLYLLDVALDLVQNYALDGINFDFIRYPGRTFADQESYRRYGIGIPRDAWRLANITRFVSQFASRARPLSPNLKIGSSPLGVYETDSASNTLGSPQAVYQDSQSWLREGFQDYVSPQLYWDIGTSRGDPDFGVTVERWQRGSFGRHIYAGIGAYKPEVFREIPRQIDLARSAGTAGQAYFRLENIRSLDMFGGRYESPALIPPMSWRDNVPPLPPLHLAVTEIATNIFHLEWTPAPKAPDGDGARWYVIYRSSPAAPRTDFAPNIITVVPGTQNHYTDTVTVPAGFAYYYAVTALDKMNNESEPSTTETGVVHELLALKGKLSNVTALSASFGQARRTPSLLAYRIAAPAHVILEVLWTDTAGKDSLVAVLLNDRESEGTHILGMEALHLAPGDYTLRLQAGTTVLEQPLRIPATP
jgi:uncharacterized lipoprotein YddW (UPF0748 family)